MFGDAVIADSCKGKSKYQFLKKNQNTNIKQITKEILFCTLTAGKRGNKKVICSLVKGFGNFYGKNEVALLAHIAIVLCNMQFKITENV